MGRNMRYTVLKYVAAVQSQWGQYAPPLPEIMDLILPSNIDHVISTSRRIVRPLTSATKGDNSSG